VLVVWQDNRNGNWDVFGRDLSQEGDFGIVEHVADQQRPAISGRTVAWEDWRDYGRGPNVYVMDLDDGDPVRLTRSHDAYEPAISGRWVVWVGRTDPGVFARNLDDDRQLRLSSEGGPKSQPAISGEIVVWTDERHGNRDVYGYDLATGQEFVVVKAHGDQDYPHVDGATIVWSDGRGPNRDIYAGRVGMPERNKPSGEAPLATAPAPAAAPAPAPVVVQVRVVGTDGAGVKLRAAPGLDGAPIRTIPEGTVLVSTGETRQADGLTWRSVRDADGRDGWVAAEYVAPL
jgi:beta propeller repeat protein